MLNLDSEKHRNHADLFAKCYQGRPYWLEHCLNSEVLEDRFRGREEYICRSYDIHLLKGKMSPQLFANGLQLSKLEEGVKNLCPLELMLISQILSLMFIIPKHKGAQFGLKGQCVLVPADLRGLKLTCPGRACNDNCIIPLVLIDFLVTRVTTINKIFDLPKWIKHWTS